MLSFVTGLSFGQGESVCAPMMVKPERLPAAAGSNCAPTAKATTVVWFRVKKYLPPRLSAHASASTSCWKPAARSRSEAACTAWKGVLASFRKVTMPSTTRFSSAMSMFGVGVGGCVLVRLCV